MYIGCSPYFHILFSKPLVIFNQCAGKKIEEEEGEKKPLKQTFMS